jgi:hypothetical protein
VRGNPIRYVDPTGELTASGLASFVQTALAEVKQDVMTFVSDGSAGGVVLATIAGTGLDFVSMAVEPLKAGEATGDAIGSGAGTGEIVLAAGGDTLRVATIVVPLARAARPISGALRRAPRQTTGETVATRAGRAAHRDFDPGPGFQKEFRLPSGKRVDAVNFETKQVFELKPNNPRAIRRGERQLEVYLEELNELYGGGFTGTVKIY